jgi:hypothetical protein
MLGFAGRMAFGSAAALAGLLSTTALSMAQPAGAAALVPHRAVYDLELANSEERSGISGVYGRMVYEMNGSACDGFTVNFRFVTRIDTEEFSRVTDQQTTTYEDLRAGTFEFVNRSFVDDALDSETRGSARRTDDAIDVEMEAPQQMSLALDRALFPTDHMIELIAKAKAGERFYQSHIYDGSDDGDKIMLTTTVIGEPRQPSAQDTEAKQAGPFANDTAWPVTIAYFNEADSGDEVPEYQISFKLYENGLTRDLEMDYGDFALRGTLTGLEVFDAKACAEQP